MENTSILVYLLKSTVAFTALYGLYILLFRKNQQFAISRFYLVFTIVFASLFPFIKFITYKTVEIPAFETAIPEVTGVGSQIIANQPQPAVSIWNQLNINNVTLYLYLIVSSLILVRLLYMLIRFGVNLLNHSRVERLYGKRVIVSDYWNQTFSFFGIIVLPQKDFQLKENQLLIQHELVHVRQFHTLDLLLAELFQVLHWFNPLAHFIKKDMREVHEFLADFNVVKGGASKYAYQQLLLNYLASSVTPRVANSFSAKLLKKRFAMMTTNKTPKSVLFKYLLTIPVVAVLIGLMSFQTRINYTYSAAKTDNKVETVEEMSPAMDVNNFSIAEVKAKEEVNQKNIASNESSRVEEIPSKLELLKKSNIKPLEFKEIKLTDITKSEDLKTKLLRIITANEGTYLKDFLIGNSSIPVILKQGVTYRFYVVWSNNNKTSDNGFVLTRENKEKIVDVVQPIKAFKGKEFLYLDYFCETTGVYRIEMSNYVADNKHTVGLCFLNMDDSYVKEYKKVEVVEINSVEKQDTSKKDYFVVVEEMPKFENKAPETAREYIAKNTQYPKIAKENGIEGSVFVNFVVESNGKVSNVKVARSVDPSLDKEAIRVIESMPDWTPGKQHGKNVPVQFTLPVVFKLAEKQQNIDTEEVALTTQRGDKTEPFVVVEEMPKFDNKDVEAAKEYIAKNLKYPVIAVKNGIQGKVYVSFVVEPDGAVSEVKIERGVDPSIDNEAIRVIESMPKWTPGYQRGQAVRVKITLPVIFKLDDKK